MNIAESSLQQEKVRLFMWETRSWEFTQHPARRAIGA